MAVLCYRPASPAGDVVGMPRLKNLKAVRESKLLSQAMLAARSGVSRPTINRLEQERVEARYVTIHKLAAALGVEPAALVGSSEE